jgi:CRISPR-associated exonuclease Cas4
MTLPNLTGTHISYYHVCHRKLWLFANGIQMEHTSDIVAEGKLIAETTYLDRARKYTELAIDGIKIDFYDAKNAVVHEVKKSDKVEKAHKAQVSYYLYVLVKNGIENPSAIIEYPKLKQRDFLEWDEAMIPEIETWLVEVAQIILAEVCPPVINAKICKSCSYFELCYINEE